MMQGRSIDEARQAALVAEQPAWLPRAATWAMAALLAWSGPASHAQAPGRTAASVPAPRPPPAQLVKAAGPAATASAASVANDSRPQVVSLGLFSDVRVHRPAGATPNQFVLLLSANDTPSAVEQTLVRKMLAAGASVAVVPLAPFYRRLEAQDGATCTYAGGAFENLGRRLQAFEKLPTYRPPLVVGSGSASPFAYALLAQSPAGTFSGALSLDFCPRLALRTPLCAVNALRWQAGGADAGGAAGVDLLPATALPAPWTALQATPAADGTAAACSPASAQAFTQRVGQGTWVAVGPAPAAAGDQPAATFDAAYAALVGRQSAGMEPPPSRLSDVPIVEVPASGAGSRFAVLLSGDGGWAAIDKGIAAGLVARGVPVAGFDSLRYFWTARTPEGVAADLDRVIRYYAARFNRGEVILIGYSQGADVLPFAINRLPAATRARVKLTALLGLGQKASFEFHLSNWIGASGDKPIAPEARKLRAADTLCIYGLDEKEPLCPALAPVHMRPLSFPGGHHFGGDYEALATHILDAVPK